MSTLQDRMLQYRAKERISQQELADKCGVSKQTIYSIENGLQTPSKVTVTKIELVVGRDE
jgi:DNA-binding XRE family transcriptional regulator